MLYAKSNPEESIIEHTEKLLSRLEKIKNIYGKEILKNKNIDEEKFWKLLNLACTYHDFGKAYTPFQNMILKDINKPLINTDFNYIDIKHEQLSPLFIPFAEMDLSKEEKKILIQAVYYHHERNFENFNKSMLVKEIIEQDILPRIENIEEELKTKINKEPNSFYLTYVGYEKRIKEENNIFIVYCLIKGLLHRLDYSASANVEIEDETRKILSEYVDSFMQRENYKINDLQEFCKKNKEENIIIIGSTGIGKTEAALYWCGNFKTFFALPIRISINAIFDRIKHLIGYEHIGLLHSTSLEYLEEKEENSYLIYEQSKILASKITICTIDQIFTFVFKFKGYEKIYATLAYSKIIIDEIQAYSPNIVAVIIKGIEMINNINGRFMIMTATLPRIYKEELEKRGVEFKFNTFLKDTKRHKIKIEDAEITENVLKITQKSKNKKVLVIVNTINKAIEIYLKLKEVDNVKLLHSRFTINDKSRLENEIQEFSKSNDSGIWITTQIVEASLDIDFDYLFTEMSTLDSLFQRLGRCYRNREYTKEEANVYIYKKNSSGIGYIYDEDINKKSIELLEQYNNKILLEQNKIDLVDVLYSRDILTNTKFLKEFDSSMSVLNNIIDYETSKMEAQKMLRNIENIKVIPRKIYDENLNLFEDFNNTKLYKEKSKIKREIEKLTINVRKNSVREVISPIKYMTDIFLVDLKYDYNVGLILTKDNEYNIDSRIL